MILLNNIKKGNRMNCLYNILILIICLLSKVKLFNDIPVTHDIALLKIFK
jgi:hypothetical protein